MGIGNSRHCRPAASTSTSHYPSWGLETRWARSRSTRTRSHYPSWGLETSGATPLEPVMGTLITPHGDWKRTAGRGNRPRCAPHYPSWGLETVVTSIGPGDLVDSLPLMGIGNTASQILTKLLTVLITPHGDWKLHGGYQSVRVAEYLITPHGDWKLRRIPEREGGRVPHYPSWGLETSGNAARTCPGLSAHYPSWGLETRWYRHCSRTPSSHYPSWGLETIRLVTFTDQIIDSLPLMGIGNGYFDLDVAQFVILITPHGDWKPGKKEDKMG